MYYQEAAFGVEAKTCDVPNAGQYTQGYYCGQVGVALCWALRLLCLAPSSAVRGRPAQEPSFGAPRRLQAQF